MNRKPASIFLVAEETLGGFRLPREPRHAHAACHNGVSAAPQAAQHTTFRLTGEHTGEES